MKNIIEEYLKFGSWTTTFIVYAVLLSAGAFFSRMTSADDSKQAVRSTLLKKRLKLSAYDLNKLYGRTKSEVSDLIGEPSKKIVIKGSSMNVNGQEIELSPPGETWIYDAKNTSVWYDHSFQRYFTFHVTFAYDNVVNVLDEDGYKPR